MEFTFICGLWNGSTFMFFQIEISWFFSSKFTPFLWRVSLFPHQPGLNCWTLDHGWNSGGLVLTPPGRLKFSQLLLSIVFYYYCSPLKCLELPLGLHWIFSSFGSFFPVYLQEAAYLFCTHWFSKSAGSLSIDSTDHWLRIETNVASVPNPCRWFLSAAPG